MAFILNNLGYHVIVNDMSENRELGDIISFNDFNIDIKTYRNVDFNFSGEYLEGYDFMIDYYDDLSKKVSGERFDCIILNSSVSRSELEICRRIINVSKSDVIMVIRDRTDNCINRKYIMKYIITAPNLLKIHEINLDFYDKEYQFMMDYDGIGKVKYLSENYVNVLSKTVCSVTGKGQGSVKKAIKNMREGRIFDNRFLE